MKKKLFGFILIFLINSCNPKEGGDCHKELFLKNNNETSIYILFNPDGGITTDNCNSFSRKSILAMTSSDIARTNNSCLETIISNTFGNLIRIYFFTENSGELDCQNITENEFFIEFRDYNLEDIQAVTWEIPYSNL